MCHKPSQGKEQQCSALVSKQITFGGVESSSWLASPGLPGWGVRKGADEIFFTAPQNHLPHLMKLSRIVQPTVKLGICIRKFYKELKGLKRKKKDINRKSLTSPSTKHNEVKIWSITTVLWQASYIGTPSAHRIWGSALLLHWVRYFLHCISKAILKRQLLWAYSHMAMRTETRAKTCWASMSSPTPNKHLNDVKLCASQLHSKKIFKF